MSTSSSPETAATAGTATAATAGKAAATLSLRGSPLFSSLADLKDVRLPLSLRQRIQEAVLDTQEFRELVKTQGADAFDKGDMFAIRGQEVQLESLLQDLGAEDVLVEAASKQARMFNKRQALIDAGIKAGSLSDGTDLAQHFVKVQSALYTAAHAAIMACGSRYT
jgi:hypothetical protein